MHNKFKKSISAFLFLIPLFIGAQNFSLSNSSSIIVSGTSSLHDWDVISNNFSGKMELKDFTVGHLESLEVYLATETLKSGKNAMDKKTYKALKTNEFNNIKFKMVEIKTKKRINDSAFTDSSNEGLTRNPNMSS